MLVDNGSFTNILFGSTLNKMQVNYSCVPMVELLYSFTRDAIIPRGQIILAIEICEEPTVLYRYIDFLIMDSMPAYNEILGRPPVKI